jgi:hypothetical protein
MPAAARAHRTRRGFAAMSEANLNGLLQRPGWELLGPSPL